MDKVSSIIKAAARAKAAIDRFNDLDGAEYEDGLRALNAMLALWAAEGITIYNVITESFTLVTNKPSYTIGTGGDFNTTRPTDIYYALIRDAGNNDYAVSVITDEEFDCIANKTTPGRPNRIQLKPGYPLATLTVYPVPLLSETIVLANTKVIASFASIDDDINLPPEFEEALIYNLSLRIIPEVPPTALVADLAAKAKDAIYTIPVAPLIGDAALSNSFRPFNIYRGQ